MKRAAAVFIALVLLLAGCSFTPKERGVKVVCASFAEYDWTRELCRGTETSAILLSDNGADLHSYLPTARDIVDISTSDLFIYCRGNSQSWAEDVLNTSAKGTQAVSITDFVMQREEELVEGMEPDEEEEEEAENDEHVWLSLKNAQAIVNGISSKLSEIDSENAQIYQKNARDYVGELKKLDEKMMNVKAEKQALLFAGRFPFAYFVHDYDIEYYAAFAGCSAQTEASFETIAFLSQKAKDLDLKYEIVLTGEDESLADAISQNTGGLLKLEVDPMQSVRRKELDEGKTYLQTMRKNIEAIIKALEEE